MIGLGRLALIAAMSALGTAAFGWWSLVIVGAMAGVVLQPAARPVLLAAAGAAAGWLILLNVAAFQGPVGELGFRVAVALGVPRLTLFVLVVTYPALVAGSAAWFAQEVMRWRSTGTSPDTVHT